MDESKELEKISILFQSQLQLGASPSISEFVSKADDSLQAKLLENLIEIEVQHRIGKESANRDSSDRNSDLDVTLPPKVQSDVGDMTLPPKGTSNDDDATIPPKGSHANFEDTALPLPYHKSSQIGPYKLLQKIGEGGMGAVWMAEQKEPVRRRVALKLIKSDLASKEIVARFEAERQALAMMDHPNIATVLDVGTTDKGDPFFVMELIQGIPLNEYCDQHELGVNERLRLMVDICDAMQHAHQKGIIHRDLKPTNVLVTEYNGKPVPKVIDFGLAKALQHTTRLTDKTVFTEFGRVVGTLQYMSPEQAQLDSMDVDTRTDVYSLGVMLYELLAGSTPLDRDTMARNAILQVLELIREKDPDRPSHRLSSASTDSAEISRKRQIAPSKLQQILRGELDWIVMKALEKDRNRRYETASGFAADLERYLRDEPVLALPPSFNYRFKKFVRKNRVVVTAAALVAFALVAGLVGTTWGLFRALNAEAKALSANNKTIEALEAAEAANLEEATQRRFAEAVAEFVEKDFLALTSV
ncbi:MAG: serine/threonine-protein kinase, partial [Planctomycetota bacterium]